MAFNRAYKMTAVILAALILLVINGCGSGQLDNNKYVTILVTESGGHHVQVTRDPDTGGLSYADNDYPLGIKNVPLAGTADDPLGLKIIQVSMDIYEGAVFKESKTWYPDFLIEGGTIGFPPLPTLITTTLTSLGPFITYTCNLTIYSTEIDKNGNTGADHIDESIGTVTTSTAAAKI